MEWRTGQSLAGSSRNILHHRDARYFTRHSWFHSSWDLACLGLVVLASAWLRGQLTWEVWLVVVLGANANQMHKWAHRSPAENGPVISLLQRIRLIQTPCHHSRHHTDPKNSHYCVLTNVLNPILDGIQLWDALEWVIRRLFRLRRRIDTSVSFHDAGRAAPKFPWGEQADCDQRDGNQQDEANAQH